MKIGTSALKTVQVITLVMTCLSLPAHAENKPRARDLGIPFSGTPGLLNAITDVSGIEVGHQTLIAGEGKLVVGKGPVRTGVTAILPRGNLPIQYLQVGILVMVTVK